MGNENLFYFDSKKLFAMSFSETSRGILSYSRFSNGEPPSGATKWWAALIIGILFFILASPLVVGWVNFVIDGVFGTKNFFASPGGLNLWGLFFMSLAFALVVRLLMG